MDKQGLDSLVIGTRECTVTVVLRILKSSSDSFSRFRSQWSTLATSLDTPPDEINKLRADLLLDKIGLIDVIVGVLSEWVARVGSGATLRKFLEALEENGLGGCAESLTVDLTLNKSAPSQPLKGSSDGWKTVDKISFNASHVLGLGSGGTFVYSGKFDGREVAVKRVLSECCDYAEREVELLKKSDQHGNIIRYFCMETDGYFRYLALELCQATIGDWMEGTYINDKIDGMRVLREATKGLTQLHSLGIVHRDVKPANILLREWARGDRAVSALISDFGLSKNIQTGGFSYANTTAIAWGTGGWAPPEVINAKFGVEVKMTLAVDVFALGCIYYYVLSKGHHPFGEAVHRQSNIIKDEFKLDRVRDMNSGGTIRLITHMISRDPFERPALAAIRRYPTFWSCLKSSRELGPTESVWEGCTSRLTSNLPPTSPPTTTPTLFSPFSEIYPADFDVNKVGPAGETELHRVARKGDEVAIRDLINLGADVNVKNNANRTPLHEAGHGSRWKYGNTNITACLGGIDLLIEHGANVHSQDYWRNTFLHFLLDSRTSFVKITSTELIQLLVKYGPLFYVTNKAGDTALNLALQKTDRRSEPVVERLIRYELDYKRLYYNVSLLFWAAFNGNVDALAIFIKTGGLDINGKNDSGDTPLHAVGGCTIQNSKPLEDARLLLDNGASKTAKNNDGQTPYDKIKKRLTFPDQEKVLQLLL